LDLSPLALLQLVGRLLWPLVLLPLALRLLTPADSDDHARWDTRRDLGLAVLCGAFATLASVLWMPRYFMDMWALSAWDFNDYCSSIGAFRHDPGAVWHPNRSVVAGWLPSLLARRLGVFDALFVSAMLSHVVTGMGLYLWGRALHGRTAGIAAVMICCAVAPVVALARTITFYPEIVAVCVASAAGAALAIRFRTLPAIGAGSLGIGWVLLVDFRGLLFALPQLAVVAVAISWPARGGNPARARGLMALVAALLISWFAGSHAFGPNSLGGLEGQTQALVAASAGQIGVQTPGSGPCAGADLGFVWGRTSPLGIPRTLICLTQIAQAIPDDIAMAPRNVQVLEAHLAPWIGPCLVALAALAWRLRRRWEVLVGFLVIIAPFVVTLWVGTRVWAQARYLSHGMVFIPVLLGAGFAALLQGPKRVWPWPRATAEAPATSTTERRAGRPIRAWLALSLLGLCVLGALPSWIGPKASWRWPVESSAEPYHWAERVEAGRADLRIEEIGCVNTLTADVRAGIPVTGRLFPLFPRHGQVGPTSLVDPPLGSTWVPGEPTKPEVDPGEPKSPPAP
jgi:hypothetical protein